MRKALSVTGRVVCVAGKTTAIITIFIGHFIMNCIGALICAISD